MTEAVTAVSILYVYSCVYVLLEYYHDVLNCVHVYVIVFVTSYVLLQAVVVAALIVHHCRIT